MVAKVGTIYSSCRQNCSTEPYRVGMGYSNIMRCSQSNSNHA